MTRVERQIGGQTLSLETGHVAKQAGGSVWARLGDTIVLATVCFSDRARDGIDFLPLSVEYREQMYAAGKIPGGRFFKREGRPSEKEVVTCRVIDRAMRPLFNPEIRNEIQFIINVLSFDGENDPDVLGMIGAYAALAISNTPFDKELASVRISRVGDEYVTFPTMSQREEAEATLVVAATRDEVLMLECESSEASKDVVYGAIEGGLKECQPVIEMISELRDQVGVEKAPMPEPELDEDLRKQVKQTAESRVRELAFNPNKLERQQGLSNYQDEVVEQLVPDEEDKDRRGQVKRFFHDLEEEVVRTTILRENKRPDGRQIDEIRPLASEVGLLPRTHGSALFTRGQTQSLAVTTLGTTADEQIILALEEEVKKRFILQYNFPPFSVGEVKPMRGPGRREIGHGALAEKALVPVIPNSEEFPYMMRVVSDILESNGSSSMASVCGASLSLMDAGVPIKAPVAGISIGLVKEGDEFVTLTDIQGAEDHFGDMDFKVAGTRNGITAIQLDIKLHGISLDVCRKALDDAEDARMKILDNMATALAEPRADLSPYAPRITQIKIDVDKIRDIIGPGGKVIRGIVEKTGVKIDVEDDGTVLLASTDEEAAEKAMKMIKAIVSDPEIGAMFDGVVKRVTNFGAFVEILPGKEGLCHISQLAENRVEKVEDVVNLGDEIKVKLIGIDDMGRLDLSKKAADRELRGEDPEDEPPRERRGGGGGGGRDRGGRGGGGGRGGDRGGRGGRDRGGRGRD